MNARTHSQLLQGRGWVPVPGHRLPGPEELCFGYVEEAQLGLEALEWGKGREAGEPRPMSLISGLFQQFRTWYSGSLYGCGSPSLSCPDLGISVSLFWVLGSEADHMTVGGPPLQPTWLSVYPSKSLCLCLHVCLCLRVLPCPCQVGEGDPVLREQVSAPSGSRE